MMKVLLIAVGGGAGTLFRYFLSGWGQSFANGWFPLGTLLVNLAGCLLIGALGAFFAGPHLIREEYRLALLVGVLGGLTTYSSFGWETFALAKDGEMWLALANILLTNVLGLFAVWFGYRVAENWFGA